MHRGTRVVAVTLLLSLVGLLWLLAFRAVGWSGQGLLALGPVLAILTGVVLLPVVVLVRGRYVRLGTAVLCLLLLLPAVPLGWHTVAPRDPGPGDLTVLTWNMQDHEEAVGDLESAVVEYEPDLVVIEQTPVGAVARSAALRERLPYQLLTEADVIPTSVAILSRYPLDEHRALVVGPDWPVPRVVVAVVDSPRGPITVFGAHPRWPLPEEGRGYGGWRDPQLADLATAVADTQAQGADRVLVVGDLNVTTRERAYRDLRKVTALDDAADWAAWSAMGTWRRTGRTVPGFLPLDHVLHSPCLTSTGTRALWKYGGSDHSPVVSAFEDRCP